MLLVMIFHPDTNSLVSGTAHCILYISNYATAFWAIAALRYGMQYQRVFLILFLINATSAFVGIGQFYRPNTFLPPSIMVLEKEKDSFGSLIPYYTLEDGTKILRPCGLSDTPGAASYSSAMAAIMGIIVMSSKLPLWQRLSGLAAIPGATVIYLTQVRTAILMIVVSLMALVFVMILQRRLVNRHTNYRGRIHCHSGWICMGCKRRRELDYRPLFYAYRWEPEPSSIE